jgi:hypothetical protein
MKERGVYRGAIASQLNKWFNPTCNKTVNGKTLIHFPL